MSSPPNSDRGGEPPGYKRPPTGRSEVADLLLGFFGLPSLQVLMTMGLASAARSMGPDKRFESFLIFEVVFTAVAISLLKWKGLRFVVNGYAAAVTIMLVAPVAIALLLFGSCFF